MSERIDIELQDKVDSGIASKIIQIAEASDKAHVSLNKLKKQLSSIDSSSLNTLANASAKIQNALARETTAQAKLEIATAKASTESSRAALIKQRLATETQKTQAAIMKTETALNAAVIAENKSTVSSEKVIAVKQRTQREYLKTEAALNKAVESETLASVASQKLATETQKTAAAFMKSEEALNKAVNAEAKIAVTNQKLTTETNKSAISEQKLATELQRTAAATSRAELSALRLANAQNKVSSSSHNAYSGVSRFVKGALAVAGITVSANELVQIGDAYTVVENKLKNVTDSEEQLNEVTGDVFKIAKDTRAPVLETALAFQRFDLALSQLGASQKETLRLTETINKAMAVSGAQPSEMSAGLLQLSQAFNKGKLDGDEFRSVMELMPPVADAIAKQLGVTRGELLKLAPDGKITAEVMRKALASVADEIDKKFAKTTPTIAQYFTVLRNEATLFFGEINKSLGVTQTFANIILWLADNMETLTLALAVLSAALLSSFGPSLIAMLSSATKAVAAFTLSLLTNPFALFLTGLTAAISYVTLFGDEIKLSSDGLVTLKDVALAMFSYIKQGIETVTSYITSAWNTAIDFISSLTQGWGEKFRNVGSLILGFVKDTVNSTIAFWVGAYNAVISSWNIFPGAFKDIITTAYNNIIGLVEKISNLILEPINSIRSAINDFNTFTGGEAPFKEPLVVSLDEYKKEVTGAASDLGDKVEAAFSNALGTDFVGNAVTALDKRAREIAKSRISGDSSASSLRSAGQGVSVPDYDKNAAKQAEKRALALEKINSELDKELSRMFTLKPERDIQAKMDEIETSLIQKKIKLTDEEKQSIHNKIKAIENAKVVQQQYDAIYESVVGPARNYNATLEAANKLFQQGSISQAQYNKAVNKSAVEYEKASNPLSEITRDLEQQIELLKYYGPELERQQQIQQMANSLREQGIKLTGDEISAIESKLTYIQSERNVQSELSSIYDDTLGYKQQLIDRETALNEAYNSGVISLENYKSRIIDLRGETASLKLEMGEGDFNDVLTASLSKMIDSYKNAMYEMSNVLGDLFTTLEDGIADSIGRSIVYAEDLGSALLDVARSAVSSLISSLIKLGIQAGITQLLGQSLSAAGTATTAAMASASAAAWAPAAAYASLASYGTNAGAAMTGIQSTLAMAQGMALTTGFERGGYTGNLPTNAIAGVVHGQEYVLDASTVSRIGVSNLQDLQNGAAYVQTNSESASKSTSGGSSSTYEGNSESASVNTNLRIINVVDKGLMEDYLSSPEGEQVFVNIVKRNSDSIKQVLN